MAVSAPPPAAEPKLWSLKPVVRPEPPKGITSSSNPIDAFLAQALQDKGLKVAGPADKLTLLRRVSLDLTGLPPTPAEQEEFLKDESPQAYEKVVDRLLSSEQHGVRYGRHWLDVLRYADVDERMHAQAGIHFWRDWVVHALNRDLPYDQFVRTQLTGYRNERTVLSNIGVRSKAEPRADDLFALGFLARGSVTRDNKDTQELPIVAVETVSTAFMGLTVGCAKCHDHMYDPITQKDFYSMKALFDPLVVKKITLASPADIMTAGDSVDDAEAKRVAEEAPILAEIDAISGGLRRKLEEERILMLPPAAQAAVRKPEKLRTLAEQTLVDDYTVPLRVDNIKVKELLPPDLQKKYDELQKKLTQIQGGAGGGRRGRRQLPAFWTVEVDTAREKQQSYILSNGEVEQPQKDKPVEPGWPFGPADKDFRDGRVAGFADWLTAPDNPLFARVAVNRLWQWHFGQGLHKTSSDFGVLGGEPTNQKLLDWLASEFVARKFSMKAMHRLIVTSDAYRRSSSMDVSAAKANQEIDPANDRLWAFPLKRLEAEAIWDSIFASAGMLDTKLGGASFDISPAAPGDGPPRERPVEASASTYRRGAYMIRGFSTNREVIPNFLQAFDVEDGRLPCPLRTRTITAPQGLFLMNGAEIEKATAKVAERVRKDTGEDLGKGVERAYEITLGRQPSPREKDEAMTYVGSDASRIKGLAWLLFNLDEFVFVR